MSLKPGCIIECAPIHHNPPHPRTAIHFTISHYVTQKNETQYNEILQNIRISPDIPEENTEHKFVFARRRIHLSVSPARLLSQNVVARRRSRLIVNRSDVSISFGIFYWLCVWCKKDPQPWGCCSKHLVWRDL